MIYFLLHALVQLVLILLHNISIKVTETVDGSNESLDHADEELDTLLTNLSPLQKNSKFEMLCVIKINLWRECTLLILKFYWDGKRFVKGVSNSSSA